MKAGLPRAWCKRHAQELALLHETEAISWGARLAKLELEIAIVAGGGSLPLDYPLLEGLTRVDGRLLMMIVSEAMSSQAGRFVVTAGRVFISGGQAAPSDEAEELMTFPTRQGLAWSLSRRQVDEWQKAMPEVDVLMECRKALLWVVRSPSNRKTDRGMVRFLESWLMRAHDGPKRQGNRKKMRHSSFDASEATKKFLDEI